MGRKEWNTLPAGGFEVIRVPCSGRAYIFWEEKVSQVSHESLSQYPLPASNSTSSESGGGPPPVWHQETPQAGADSDAAKDTAHVVANMRVHRRSHIKATRNCMFEGTSRALANASIRTIWTASSLHLPPVSMASTTSLHRPDVAISGYVDSLSCLAWINVGRLRVLLHCWSMRCVK